MSVVIPSIKDDVLTLESVPEDVPVSVEREGSLNEARNRGIENAETDIVAVLDDDIAFSEELFYALVDEVDEDVLLGVADWEFGLVAGRVMIFYKSLWRDIDGFNERLHSHNGDTDFSLRAHNAGYSVKTVPRHLFYHEDHERSITTWDRAWRLMYLCGKHVRYAPYILSATIAYNLGLEAGISKEQNLPASIRHAVDELEPE
ncbi:glycosyltransferase family 2 protein [Haloterrigena salifodinae]|uniref:glycosyltransferase family 2 protein n=1 Tax=Haloterrigena salifodinae TaxID=2675099 RepID=UPI0013DEA186|nr:glycosyltransferase [Haloterrigena salifodinae]